MRTIVISRSQAETRRALQTRQMARLGLPFEFLDAEEASGLTEADCREAAQTWPGSTSRQDVACFRSHRKAWEMIAKGHELVLVLEDDAILAGRIVEALAAIEARSAPWNHVYDLEYTPEIHLVDKRQTWRDDAAGIRASRVYRNRVGLAGYVIGPRAAARMHADTVRYALADSYFWHRPWIVAQQIEPAQVVQLRFLPGGSEEAPFQRSPDAGSYRASNVFARRRNRLMVELMHGRAALAGLLSGAKRPLAFDPSVFTI